MLGQGPVRHTYHHGAYQDIGDRHYQEDGFIACDLHEEFDLTALGFPPTRANSAAQRGHARSVTWPGSASSRPALKVFAVLDGHGGDACVKYAQMH